MARKLASRRCTRLTSTSSAVWKVTPRRGPRRWSGMVTGWSLGPVRHPTCRRCRASGCVMMSYSGRSGSWMRARRLRIASERSRRRHQRYRRITRLSPISAQPSRVGWRPHRLRQRRSLRHMQSRHPFPAARLSWRPLARQLSRRPLWARPRHRQRRPNFKHRIQRRRCRPSRLRLRSRLLHRHLPHPGRIKTNQFYRRCQQRTRRSRFPRQHRADPVRQSFLKRCSRR